jgi:hypothetical protein
MLANCTTPVPAPQRKRLWPRKKDYVYIDRAEAVLIVTYYDDLFGLDSLHKYSNFRHVTFIQPGHLDNFDLAQAIRITIASVVENHSVPGVRMLRDHLEGRFGSLDNPIAISVCGWPALHLPGARLH